MNFLQLFEGSRLNNWAGEEVASSKPDNLPNVCVTEYCDSISTSCHVPLIKQYAIMIILIYKKEKKIIKDLLL